MTWELVCQIMVLSLWNAGLLCVVAAAFKKPGGKL